MYFMTIIKSQNPLIAVLLCVCGWLFGMGMYEMVRPVVLDTISASVVTQWHGLEKHERLVIPGPGMDNQFTNNVTVPGHENPILSLVEV